MSIRMGITSEIPNLDNFIDCGMVYDYNFISKLEFVPVACNKCIHGKDKNIDNCYGCYRGLDGYHILPKYKLLENPNVVNYEAMLEKFEDNNVDKIYLILK